MEGKVLVLCSEKRTLDQYGNRIDENGNMLRRVENDKWVDLNEDAFEVDENKIVINGMDLVLPIAPESVRDSGSMIFIDWESIIPNDIENLQGMISCASSIDPIQPDQILNWGEFSNMMQKAHFDRLMTINESGLRPCIDYKFQAMNDFMKLFSETLEKHMVATIIPAFSVKDSEDTVKARIKLIQGWKNSNDMMAQKKGQKKIKVAQPIIYQQFSQIFNLADKEMSEINSAPYDFEDGNR